MRMLHTDQIREKDLEELAALEQEIFPDPWSKKGLEETLGQPGAVIFGVWEEEILAGYVIFYYVPDEGEIARIGVARPFRRRGAAGMLFERLLMFCAERGVEKLFLEVRESNAPARAFYRKCGFKENGIRKKFYTNPSEDAILMDWSGDFLHREKSWKS